MGDFEVYKAFQGDLCAGTLRRIELHTLRLAQLFDIEPPHARLFLYADASAIDEVCAYSTPVWGCARTGSANALPAAATHEIVHLFVSEVVGPVETRPLLEEGVAGRLEGNVIEGPADHVIDLQELLAIRSSTDLPRLQASVFMAWVIEHAGIDSALDVLTATSEFQADEDVTEALASTLGFDSLDELQAQFDETRAALYPPLPDVTRTLSAEGLAEGVVLDTSCVGSFAEGPNDQEIVTSLWLEIDEPGQYEVLYEPIPSEDLDPWLVPLAPIYERDLGAEKAQLCPYDTPVPRFVFPSSGRYGISITHSVNESYRSTLSVRRIAGDECSLD